MLQDEADFSSRLSQTRMTRPGSTIKPQASDKELKLLQAKYSIFLECVTLQRKWRAQVREALGE